MNPNDNDDSRSVALYWDFENLHAGIMEAKYGEGAYAKQDNRFKVQEPLIDVQALVELQAAVPMVNPAPPSAPSPSTVPTATGSTSAATVTRCCRVPSS
jgi:hypothetical protein